eukprot:TRINITY_DN1247_c0_g1_i14.p1 TRINITY_DN1247_c0_g1~~TRINITY_DN1247_c0_g1_i14.p1  ORF type:complete len:414 (+),score=72.22 TRINITY_DN1247_c0_g1_i14:1747-2988(+)
MLGISEIGDVKLQVRLAFWKLNLIAFNRLGSLAVTAEDSAVLSFDVVRMPFAMCFRNKTFVADAPVNQLQICQVDQVDVIIIVDDAGGVYCVNFDGHLLMRCHMAESAWSMSFSTAQISSGMMAVGCNAHTVSVFNVRDGVCLRTLQHHHNVPCAAFNSSGGTLASCSIDGTVRLWDVSTGRCTQVHHGWGEWCWSVTWLSDAFGITADADDDADDDADETDEADGNDEIDADDADESESTVFQQCALAANDDVWLPRASQLLLVGTTSHLVLLDQNLCERARVVCAVPPVCALPAIYSGFARLSLVQWLPEHSVVFVASQGGMQVCAFQVVVETNADNTDNLVCYHLQKVYSLFSQAMCGIVGLSSYKMPADMDDVMYRVVVLFHDGVLRAFDVSGVISTPTSIPSVDALLW